MSINEDINQITVKCDEKKPLPDFALYLLHRFRYKDLTATEYEIAFDSQSGVKSTASKPLPALLNELIAEFGDVNVVKCDMVLVNRNLDKLVGYLLDAGIIDGEMCKNIWADEDLHEYYYIFAESYYDAFTYLLGTDADVDTFMANFFGFYAQFLKNNELPVQHYFIGNDALGFLDAFENFYCDTYRHSESMEDFLAQVEEFVGHLEARKI